MVKVIILLSQAKGEEKEMIEKISCFLTNQICKQQEEIDEQRAEAINYGLQLLIGEVPKIFLLFFIALLCGVGKLTFVTFLILLPYKAFSGGFHLKTHLGCIISTNLFYVGSCLAAKYIVWDRASQILLILLAGIMGIILITKYAPADTENFPILTKKERLQKKILSYIFLIIVLMFAIFIPYSEYTNAIIITVILQNLFITPIAYRITKNKYGYEVYGEAKN